ncbi:MAG: AI-2E family transporter [Acidobacteria bacterium]|nr:AI-2E family transporter [Acidobacteriota bacterium]MBV9478556.1 AI-2E family transporter [Acidobacteriota bacterium]
MPVYLRPTDRGRSELETFTRKVLIVVAIAIVVAILYAARDILVLVFLAAVLAAGISPVVRRVRVFWRFRFHRNLRRGSAVLIVYLPFLLTVLVLGIVIAPRFVSDMRSLGAQLPALVERNILTPLERYVPVNVIREQLRGGVAFPRARMFAYVRNVATVFASMIAVLFMIAYMLVDAERLRNLFLLIYPPEVRGDRRRTLNRMANRMSSWLSAQLLLSAIIGIASFAGFIVLRIPYALPLAILAAVGELIPVIGPTVGAVPALAIALLHSRWQFWSVLAFAVLLQKCENLLIVPRLMSRKVSISPLAVFIAFMIGASLLGIIGAILAIPIAAITQVAFEEAFVARRERRQDVERAGTLLRKAD